MASLLRWWRGASSFRTSTSRRSLLSRAITGRTRPATWSARPRSRPHASRESDTEGILENTMDAAHAHNGHGHHDHAHHPSGIMRWVKTTNHKDIGTLYLLFSLSMFFVGGLLALMLRLEDRKSVV